MAESRLSDTNCGNLDFVWLRMASCLTVCSASCKSRSSLSGVWLLVAMVVAWVDSFWYSRSDCWAREELPLPSRALASASFSSESCLYSFALVIGLVVNSVRILLLADLKKYMGLSGRIEGVGREVSMASDGVMERTKKKI